MKDKGWIIKSSEFSIFCKKKGLVSKGESGWLSVNI